MPVPAGAVAERRLIDRLLRANAVHPSTPAPLADLSGIQQRRLQRLITLGVVREAGAGTFYLYAPALAERMASRRRRAAMAMIFVVLIVAGMLLLVVPRG